MGQIDVAEECSILQYNEKELIFDAANGCTSSFGKLISPIESKMLSVAAGLASSPDDANDIFQEAMINAYKALPKFKNESQFSTWLYRIVLNAAMTHRRKLSNRLKYFISNSISKTGEEHQVGEYEQYAFDKTCESELHNQQLSIAINRALAHLSTNERIAFVLCHQQGFKNADAANVMQCGEGSVKSFLFRARDKMREQLKEFV